MTRTVFERSDVIPLVAEVFRELGYEGASMSAITTRTSLSKGSLYHFFPGGKEEMAREILAHVDEWFADHVFEPLEGNNPQRAIAGMWDSVDAYFRSGRRVCLVGVFALDETRDKFSVPIKSYFRRWIAALAGALARCDMDDAVAGRLAEEAVVSIQGALTVGRALGDSDVFKRTLERLRERTTMTYSGSPGADRSCE
jgi:TetR/AcrR family transcriptional regulator, lmrAB and yxaGH operons repressor